MSLVLSTVITAARDRSPWFYKTRVPDAVLARYLSDVQNELIGAASRRDPQYLAQVANVVIAPSSADAPGTAGAGTIGGTPGTSDSLGNFSATEGTAGSLVEANTTAAAGASVVLADRVVTSATATTLTSTGAGRTTNQDVSRVLCITAGTGIGQRRVILSNTAATWTTSTGSDGEQWTITPDATSMFDVVVPAYGSDDTMGVVTAIPSVTTQAGYLVKINASGTPFIDFTAPLVATIDAGVPLPAMQYPLDGTCWFADGTSDLLAICTAEQRFSPPRFPAVYLVNQTLYLTGKQTDWSDIASIALRFSPIAPAFTARTDTFLLPDHARPVLIAKAASFMAMRVNGMPDVEIDPEPHHQEAQRAEAAFLANVSAAKRGRGLRVRDVM